MKKKYESPFIMKLDIDNTNAILASGICDIDEINVYKGNKQSSGCSFIRIAYADNDEWTYI